ncbi:MAG: FKBP-type peptidyl-prolyl cis-trans isomerase [Balneolaceae bacterium]
MNNTTMIVTMKTGYRTGMITSLLLAILMVVGCSDGPNTPDISPEEDQQYLEENEQRPNVIVTDSGLQYEVIEEGDGEQPNETSLIRFRGQGWLADFTIFDSTLQSGKEARVQDFIPGLREGLLLMREGANYEFAVPGDLGFGDEGPFPDGVHPGATLGYRLELIEIVDESAPEE